ncbi:glycosyltransferase family 2 protein [Pedobacter sp. JCM 36344]|uniref:glycosyltransferase family 2 protein n=1 Tax=Pedobacter sp. JCM 36344 TaxID=3374280 RepID=UPI00397D11B7
MSLFQLPKWIKPHLFEGKNFKDLTDEDINSLRSKIKHFKSDDPDVSIMIPAWNEENNIYRTLSSLSSNITSLRVEIVVINNNSTDQTQLVLDKLGVKNYLQPKQGTAFARELGLEKALGKYHLCADSDSFYPPQWIDLMCKPLMANDNIVGVYGRYSFIPSKDESRLPWFLYEKVTGAMVRLRKARREHINFLGFNMGFITEVGRQNGGFNVLKTRAFENAIGSENFVEEAEDGRMAVNLKKTGQLKLVTDSRARVFTSARRINAEGGLIKSFKHRFLKHSGQLSEYLNGVKVE